MDANNTTKQAKAGGEYGANGSWYRGGSFINTVAENPKGSAKKAQPARAARPLTEVQVARTIAAIAAHEAQIERGEGDAEILRSQIRHLRRQLEIAA